MGTIVSKCCTTQGESSNGDFTLQRTVQAPLRKRGNSIEDYISDPLKDYKHQDHNKQEVDLTKSEYSEVKNSESNATKDYVKSSIISQFNPDDEDDSQDNEVQNMADMASPKDEGRENSKQQERHQLQEIKEYNDFSEDVHRYHQTCVSKGSPDHRGFLSDDDDIQIELIPQSAHGIRSQRHSVLNPKTNHESLIGKDGLIFEGPNSNDSSDLLSSGPSHHPFSTKNCLVYKNPNDQSCFFILQNQVFAHEWLVYDMIDRKYLADQLSHRQSVVNVQEVTKDKNSNEKLIKFAITHSSSHSQLCKILPQAFYDQTLDQPYHYHEDFQYFGQYKTDKLIVKAVIFDDDRYIQNKEVINQQVIYQNQVLKVVDNSQFHPEVLEELILVELKENSLCAIGYIVIQKVPQHSLIEIIRDYWIPSMLKQLINTQGMIEIFSKDKLIYIISQILSIINNLSQKGFGVFQSINAENLLIDVHHYTLKLSSPLIQYLKPDNQIRGYYKDQGSNHCINGSIKKKEAKFQDMVQLAEFIYNLCKILQIQDVFIGQLIKDLLNHEKQIGSIQKQFLQNILEFDPFLYYRLGIQFQKERKLTAAHDILQIYEVDIKSIKNSVSNSSKSQKSIFDKGKNKIQQGLIFKLQGELLKDLNQDLVKALTYEQRALAIFIKYFESLPISNKIDRKDEMEVKAHISILKKQLNIYGKIAQSQNQGNDTQTPNHPIISDTFLNIGLTYLQKQDFIRALLNIFKALKQRLRLDGANHQSQLKILYLIAQIYSKNMDGQQEVAIMFLKKIKKILIQNLNPEIVKDQFDLTQLYIQISNLYNDLKFTQKSLKYNEKAISIIQTKLLKVMNLKNQQQPSQILDVLVQLYNSQGKLQMKKGDFKESVKNFTLALDLLKELPNRNMQATLNAQLLANIGSAHLMLKNYAEAIQYLQESKSFKSNGQSKTQGKKPEQYIIDQLKICECYKGLQDYKSCESIYQQLIDYTKINLPDRLEQIANYYEQLAEIYQYQSDLQEDMRIQKALEMIKQAVDLYKKSSIERYSDIYIKALLINGVLSLKTGENIKDLREEITTILKNIFTNSGLFAEYSEIISDGIFNDAKASDMVLQVCGPFKNNELFRQSRAKEKWRMLVLESNID
ncbi:tetratricopeptide protein [Stylonychia lemnae]|uniref:Tetratricopeptide protein n=1 Tax=Stylonychia lemnae TaxID=5949 RepID=A0A078AM30_STYLE|nr:tetratricopeptide protein [Stylonychia lemnae]|eukprot:CDW82931.1 tetratricopeptide protein [Stylonychia lemnae]